MPLASCYSITHQCDGDPKSYTVRREHKRDDQNTSKAAPKRPKAVEQRFQPEPERDITEKEMFKARKVMDNLPNSTQLRKFRIPVLRALCDEKDVTNRVRHSGERQTKKGFIRALIYPDDDTTDWQSRVPRDFGSRSHGKLRADVWRTCTELDLPVYLADLRSGSDDRLASSMTVREKTVMESAMFLSMSLRWGTSNWTSAIHAQSYRQYMHAYLNTLLTLFLNP